MLPVYLVLKTCYMRCHISLCDGAVARLSHVLTWADLRENMGGREGERRTEVPEPNLEMNVILHPL